jgi:hypothetical protein
MFLITNSYIKLTHFILCICNKTPIFFFIWTDFISILEYGTKKEEKSWIRFIVPIAVLELVTNVETVQTATLKDKS